MKFLNKTISFISLLIFWFFSLSESIIGIGCTSILLNPTFISQLIKDFFLFKLNLIKTQFISFSTNLIKGSFTLGIVIWLSISILILIVFELSWKRNSNNLKLILGYTALMYSDCNTLINIITQRVSSKFNIFLLLSEGFSLFGIIILLSESPLKKK